MKEWKLEVLHPKGLESGRGSWRSRELGQWLANDKLADGATPGTGMYVLRAKITVPEEFRDSDLFVDVTIFTNDWWPQESSIPLSSDTPFEAHVYLDYIQKRDTTIRFDVSSRRGREALKSFEVFITAS